MDEGDSSTIFVDFGFDASDGLGEGVDQNRLKEIFVDKDKARDWKMIHTEVYFDSYRSVTFEHSSNIDQFVSEVHQDAALTLAEGKQKTRE